MMKSALISAILFCTPQAYAQSQQDIAASARDAYEMAHTFAECARFWDFYSLAEEVSGNAATAQNAHNMSNGARISSGYMLSTRHRLESPNDPPRTLGSWSDFIEPLAEVTRTQMMAAVEQGDTDSIQQQATICRAFAESSEEIIDELRFNATR